MTASAGFEGALPLPSPALSSPAERIALKFYFGPFRLFSGRLAVLCENCTAEPQSSAAPAQPDLSRLPAGVAGVFRRSEPSAAPAPILTRQRGVIRYVQSAYERRFIDLSGSFANYLEKFSAKTRATLKRKLRKFAELSGGTIDWRQYRTAEELMEFHRHARTISAISYQERLFDAGIPEDEGFLAEMRAQGERGLVRAYLLFHQGRPVSYIYCPIIDGRVIYGYLGFAPDFAKHSPGTVLQHLALEQLFAEGGFRLFDFTEGDGEHKRFFATHSVACADVFYLKPAPRTLLLVYGHLAMARLSAGAEALIARTGLKTRLRQALRGTA